MERKIDDLGRVAIPKELRDFYHIHQKVMLVETEQGILLTNPQYKMVKIQKK